MKIYASTIESIMKRYTGKDVWIKAEYRGQDCYIRVLDPSEAVKFYWHVNAGTYIVDMVSENDLRDLDLGWGFYVQNVDERYLHIPEPVSEYSTAELFAGYSDDSAQLERFVGKDLWVLVYGRHSSTKEYMRMYSIQNNSLIFSSIYEDLLDGTSEDYDAYTWQDIMDCYTKCNVCSKDAVHLVTPIETLSSDEVKEMLEQQRDKFADEDEDY